MDIATTRFLIICCGDRTKTVTVTDNLTFQNIKDIFRQKFEISDFFIQIFDRDCQEWIDLEEDTLEMIKNKTVMKLKAITSGQSATACGQNASDTSISASPVPTDFGRAFVNASLSQMESEKVSADASPVAMETTRSSTSMSSPSLNQGRASTSTSAASTPRRALVPQEKSKGWPKIFPFPKSLVARSTLIKLEEQKPLNRMDMKIIFDSIYSQATHYEGGLYPSPDNYDSIVDAIFREFPYLAKTAGLPTASSRGIWCLRSVPYKSTIGQIWREYHPKPTEEKGARITGTKHEEKTYWKDKIIFKFGNSRRRLDSSLPEVQAKKRKPVSVMDEPVARDPPVYTWGMARYCPDLPTSEDETTLKGHKEWLKKEFLKTVPDVSTVDLKMDLTFAKRRMLIVKEQAPVCDVIGEYPWLKNHRQLRLEFTRMGAKCGGSLEEVFMSGLKKYTPAIIKLTANKKIIVDLQKVVATFRTESQRNHGNFISALIGIICLFKEKPYKIIQINEGAPCAEDQMEIVSIKCKEANLLEVEEGAYSLIIEGEMVSEADTFIDIFLALIASIYTFNLAYPKVWEKSLLFIQNIIMNLKDGEDIDRRLISVLADLNKEI